MKKIKRFVIVFILIFLFSSLGFITVFASNPITPYIPDMTLPDLIPNTPSELTATTSSTSKINLTWTDNGNNEAGFIIERKVEGETYGIIASVEANEASYTDESLSPNTTYYYRVKAFNPFGESDYSNEASAKTLFFEVVIPGPLLITPVVPEELTATTISASEINLTWTDKSNNETGFIIERKTEGDAYALIASLDANESTYTDSGLMAFTKYYYRIKAFNGFGDSSYTDEVNATTFMILNLSPAAPEDLTAECISASQINLTWTDNATNETGFNIERKTEDGTYSVIANINQDITNYSDTSLDEDTEYFYRINAFNTFGISDYSNEVNCIIESESSEEIDENLESTVIQLYIGNTIYNINDVEIQMDAAPVIIQGRTLLPIRYIVEPLGADIKWNSVEKKVTISLDHNTIELWIGENTARVNGEFKLIDPENPNVVPVILPPGRTMLPLRFIAENLGCGVEWNGELRRVTITYPEQ